MKKLWLWKNFVDDKPEYWAFDNPYPCHPNGDPMVCCEPCGYAIFKDSQVSFSHLHWSEEKVVAAIRNAVSSSSAARSASGSSK